MAGAVLAAAVTAGTARAQESLGAAVGDPTVAFSAIFAPTCDPSNPPPSFRLDVYADGRVRYFGGPDAGEVGEREYRISSSAASRLVSQVAQAMTRSEFDRHHPPGLPVDWGDRGMVFNTRCVLLARPHAGQMDRATVLLESSVGQALEGRLKRVLGYDELICPDRGTAIQVSRYCETRVLNFVMERDETTCSFSHVVNLYEDGTVHYFVAGIDANDRFFEVDRDARNGLVRYAASLGGSEIVVVPQRRAAETHMRSSETQWLVLPPESTQMFAERLEQSVGLVWQATAMSSGCAPGLVYPRGQIGLTERR